TDMFTQGLSQIEDTLNKMLAKQKTDREALAKKYRASAESFKKGALREQIAILASRQKRMLTLVQNQKKLFRKIENYRKTKQVSRATHSEKQIMHPDVVTFGMGLAASMPNGNRVEAHLSLENRFSAQECSQHTNNCLAETEASKEAIRSKEVSDHTSTSENRIRRYSFRNMSKLTNAIELVTSSKPGASTAKTKCSQQKDIAVQLLCNQGNKSINPTSVTNTLNISEAQSAVGSNNVCQSGDDCQQALTDENLHRYVNKQEAFQQKQQQQVVLSTSTENFPSTPQQMIFQSSGNSLDADSVLTNSTSNTDYPVNLSKKSSQSYSYQECKQNQMKYERKATKKLQLIDLLQLGRIKPGENVLEFMLQEFSHKATLLKDGKIKTGKNKVFPNPVQWVKDLLGRGISVTWKYAWSNVTYCGIQLSKFLVDGMPVSNDLEIPSQQ
ncbi:ANR31 protein, partial [Penelope pileata]|nr:ANR31 protein [Penelope pileata]